MAPPAALPPQLGGYAALLRLCALLLALTMAAVVGVIAQDVGAKWRRARHWEERRERAEAVAREIAASSAGAIEGLLAEQRAAAAAPSLAPGSFPLAERLARLDDGPPAWRAYAAAVVAALRAAGCPQAAIDEAHRWNRPSFTGRRRPAAAVLAEALGSPARRLQACAVVASEALAAAQLHAEIARSQTLASEADCATARVLLLTYPWNGFASNFGVVAGALISAIRMGRVLVLDEATPWAYNGGPLCAGAPTQWECYFRRFGTCTSANAGISAEERAAAPPAKPGGGGGGPPRVVRLKQEPPYARLFYHSHLTALRPPPPYHRFGVAWWRAHHFAALWRLQPHVQATVARTLAASGLAGLDAQFLAWHVRHGDKVTEGRGLYRATKYARELQQLAAAHPAVRHVLLASDNPAVLDAAAGMPAFAPGGSGGLRLFWLRDRERLGGSAVEAAAVAQANPGVAYTLALDAITNVAALSESALALGIFHSNFGRLASELRYVKGYAVAPFVFKDAPACAAARHAHPDRDSYFVPNATAWYLPLRAARARLFGLPPGFFVANDSETGG